MRHILFFLLLGGCVSAQAQLQIINGRVSDERTGAPVGGAAVRISGTIFSTVTDSSGRYIFQLLRRPSYSLIFKHLSYEPATKIIRSTDEDSINCDLRLKIKSSLLAEVPVYAVSKPETLVGKPDYSIYDFDFLEDKLILLTAEKTMKAAEVKLSDYEGRIFSSYRIPKSAGTAQSFFHDYEGYPDLVCSDSIFRMDLLNQELMISPIPKKQFNDNLKPVADTNALNYYISDAWDRYPAMNYYHFKKNDSLATLLKHISNADLLKLYNLEYYYLPSRMQLEARRMADEYKTDKHVIAALMSGFTSSMYYDPLYAPLFVIGDTICIFDHHSDLLYHYDKNNMLTDSVKINYHHPKNWREWKRKLYVDEINEKVYALFSHDGHHYLKQISHRTGEAILTYKLKHHSADKIKIRDGYVYYVYRPFESTQEKFLYRERIE